MQALLERAAKARAARSARSISSWSAAGELLPHGDGARAARAIPRALPRREEPAHRRRSDERRHGRSRAGLSARNRAPRARALGRRRHPRAQSSERRSQALRRRRRHHARDRRRGRTRSASKCTTTSSSAATARKASRAWASCESARRWNHATARRGPAMRAALWPDEDAVRTRCTKRVAHFAGAEPRTQPCSSPRTRTALSRLPRDVDLRSYADGCVTSPVPYIEALVRRGGRAPRRRRACARRSCRRMGARCAASRRSPQTRCSTTREPRRPRCAGLRRSRAHRVLSANRSRLTRAASARHKAQR